MSRIVTIKPLKNSKVFFKNAVQYQRVTEKMPDGRVETNHVEAGDYKGERFPNSRQMFRPVWSSSHRKWKLHDLQNGDELNELVKKCRLKYPMSHPLKGQFIEEADIYDFNDPFFNHRLLRVISKEGEINLDLDRPIDNVVYLGCLENPIFSRGEKNGSVLSTRVKYQIIDKGFENKIKRNERNMKLKIANIFSKLDFKKKKKIAVALGITVGKDIEPEVLDDLLWNYAEDDKVYKESEVSRQSRFLKYSELPTEELNVFHLIGSARKANLIRKTKDGFMLFGQPIGRTNKMIEEYFKNPENLEMIDRVEEALKNK